MSVLVRRRFGPGGLSAAAALASFRVRGPAPEPTRHTISRTVVTAVWLVAVLVEFAALAIWLARGAPRLPVSFAGGPMAVLAITACSALTLSMGAFLARRLPGNLVGWVMMVPGLALLPALPSALMVHDALEVVRPVPAITLAVAWLSSSVSAPVAIGSLAVVLVLFPDGRPSSPRWAAALAVPLAGTALLILGSALDRSLIWYPMLAGPMDGAFLEPGLVWLARLAGFTCLAASVLIAAGSLIDRYRDAGELLRRQIRWVVLDGTITAIMVAPLLVGRYLLRPGEAVGEVSVVLATLGAATFPIAVAVAITRADLFDIDLIIGRTLVYLPLTAILAGMYAALVAFLQRVFVALTGDTSDAVIVLSTLVLAAAFTPIRQTLDGLVERHFRTPHGARASQGAAGGVVEPATVDRDALMALLAAHVERLEAVEARLLHLEQGPRLGRGTPVRRGSPRARPRDPRPIARSGPATPL
jgi:two-component system NarL family sensor kinase